MAGYTAAGVGSFTRSVSRQPYEGGKGTIFLQVCPVPPKEFRAQIITANDVHLTWKEPDNSNGIVKFYFIKIYNTKTGLQVGNVRNQSADKESDMQQHSRPIPGLEYYTNYTYTIQAATIKPGEMAYATARTEEGGIVLTFSYV
ncbi:unnamed protein product [Pocillopora meandrina]|uniref:Fibronectin type-III domain-containing protein n=1 Tax=Pocillopora meandrina TaxID=46732 RepID=A0AAU9WUM5_9CNID|nr:unnamed protein product [Pocillopora meandrina]